MLLEPVTILLVDVNVYNHSGYAYMGRVPRLRLAEHFSILNRLWHRGQCSHTASVGLHG